MDKLIAFLSTSNGITTAIIFLVFAFLAYIFSNAHRKGQLDWRDLITRTDSNKVSLSKILQLLGGITATWIVVKTTVSPAGISWELFTAYLTYVGSVEAYSKYVGLKTKAMPGGTTEEETHSPSAKAP